MAETTKRQHVDSISELMKVLHWLVEHNLPIRLFESLVDLVKEVDSDSIRKIQKGKNAKYTSTHIAEEFLASMAGTVQEELVEEINASPTLGLMIR